MDNFTGLVKRKRRVFINIPGKIDNLELELDSINILTGYNDVGKTYILKAIYALFRVKDYIDRFKDTWETKILSINNFKDIKDPQLVKFYLDNKEKYNNFNGDIKEFQETFVAQNIIGYVRLLILGILDINEYNLKYTENYMEFEISHLGWKYTGGLTNTSMIHISDVSQILVSDTKVLEYSNILMAMPSKASSIGINNPTAVPDFDKELINSLNKYYIDQKDKLDIRFDDLGNCEISLNGEYEKASKIGDGLKLIAILNTLKANDTLDSDSVLLLDEPDNGLHTSVYIENINNILQFNSVFLTTHNYTFINEIYSKNKDAKFFYCKTDSNGMIIVDKVSAYEASVRLKDILVGEEENFDYM